VSSEDPLLKRVRARLDSTSGVVAPVPAPSVRALLDSRRFAEALAEARRVCEASGADPAYACWIGRAAAYAGQLHGAQQWLELAVQANAEDAKAHVALGQLQRRLGRLEVALAHLHRAIVLRPGSASLRAYYCGALLASGDPAAAEREARAGLQSWPNESLLVGPLASALLAQNRSADAIELLEGQAQRVSDRDFRLELADNYLRAGKYREGFDAYEARRQQSRILAQWYVPDPPLYQPEWKGGALGGRRVLLVHEQGFGDTLMALRYAAVLSATGKEVSIAVPQALERLLRAQRYLRRVYGDGEPIPRAAYDCWCHVMSLPRLLGEDGSGGMARIPYISWKDEASLPDSPAQLRVGVCWAGSGAYRDDGLRSLSARQLAPLAKIPGVRLVCCQYGVAPTALPPRVEAPLRPIADLADTAALIAQLDLLISVDTAPAHLAGAMGWEVWLLNRWFGDWRWGDSGAATHWYPTMRILRQPRAGDWESVIAEAGRLLAERARAKRSGNPTR